ncbi:hypothetical protein ABD76_27880 [Paenibacillus dendritiformis]|uniref:M23 family metallopeptidase n=1 Tax=Paenibacillus dendritiformis TaxID=130049 RepID=UPI0018CD0F3F|nr:M23 family metallopeptidase [Paenibacillus dendritiformis]MBG9796047.1 hypothetical protein [Paenibacillus dendritiformis]
MKKRTLAVCMLALSSVIAMSGCAENAGGHKENPADETRMSKEEEPGSVDNRKADEDQPQKTEAQETLVQKTVTGDDVSGWIAGQEAAKLYEHFSPEFQEQVTAEDIDKLLRQAWKKGEAPVQISRLAADGAETYVWSSKDGKMYISAFLREGRIHGLLLRPSDPRSTDEKYTRHAYRMPFEGEWTVAWGGTNAMLNYHYEYPTQRYAYDLFIVRDGASLEGDPKDNASYFAFGQPVVAPLGGKVVKVVDGHPDNVPFEKPLTEEAAGNHVVIDHGNGEYSVLAHFKQNSILVKEGDTVKQGERLGLCGNSGNSSDAHIHFQVSDNPSLETGSSLRIRFADGGDPVRGDLVRGQDKK